MKVQRDRFGGDRPFGSSADLPAGTPGKRTLTEALPASPIQRRVTDGGSAAAPAQVEHAAHHGISGAAGRLPFLDAIQRSFGRHDVAHVQAHTDGAAAEGAAGMGARAFATGDHVAFGGAPDLHTAAHEAAHVVQQRAGVHLQGGVGEVGDAYERHADEVADLVTQGKSSEATLDRLAGGGGTSAGVQRVVTKNDRSYLSPTELALALRQHGLSSAEQQRVFALDVERTEYTLDQAIERATGRRAQPTLSEPPRSSASMELDHARREPPSDGPPQPSKATAMHGMCMGTDKVNADQVFHAIAAGYRVFDLARRYKTQAEVGQGIQHAILSGLVKRSELTLIYKFDPVDHDVEAQVPQLLLSACQGLGVDYLDVAMLHHVEIPAGALKAHLRALKLLVTKGLVHEVGLSNVSDPQLLAELREEPEMPVISMVQNEMNPLVPDDQVLEACRHFRIVYLGYSPIGGQVSKDQLLGDPALAEIALAHKLSVAQLLLRWALTRGAIPVTKSSRLEGMKENLDARGGEPLDEKTMTDIALAAKQLTLRQEAEKQQGLELHQQSLTENRNEPPVQELGPIDQLKEALQRLAMAQGESAINDALGIVQLALQQEQVVKFRRIMARAKSAFATHSDKLLKPGDLGTCDIPKIALAALQAIQM
jgi:diketogulonate reductase-like aldo/keto reductase